MTPDELYLLKVVEAILRIKGLRKGIRGLDPAIVRQAARNLIARHGREAAMLGIFGLAGASLEKVTGAFIRDTYAALHRIDIIPAGTTIAGGELLAQLRGLIRDYRDGVTRVVSASTGQVVATIRHGHVQGVIDATKAAGVKFSTTVFDDINQATRARVLTARPGAQAFDTTVRGGFDQTEAAVDKWIRKMKGRPPGNVAAELFAQAIGPDNLPGAASLGQRGQAIRRSIHRVGVIKEQLDLPGRGVYKNAKRILASETQAYNHQSNLYAAAKSPGTKYVKWSVSSDHAESDFAPDECDVLAESDLSGAGGGLYRPENAPGHPHPFCQCSVSPVSLPVSEWQEDYGKAPRPPETNDRSVKSILKRNQHKGSPALTEGRLARLTEKMNSEVGYAHERYLLHGV